MVTPYWTSNTFYITTSNTTTAYNLSLDTGTTAAANGYVRIPIPSYPSPASYYTHYTTPGMIIPESFEIHRQEPDWDEINRQWVAELDRRTGLDENAHVQTYYQYLDSWDEARNEDYYFRADGARDRAERLLREHLSPEQQETLKSKKCFYVRSQSNRLYRISRGKQHNVHLINEETLLEAVELCITVPSNSSIPEADIMLAQMLWLQCLEEQTWKTANAWAMRPESIGREEIVPTHMVLGASLRSEAKMAFIRSSNQPMPEPTARERVRNQALDEALAALHML